MGPGRSTGTRTMTSSWRRWVRLPPSWFPLLLPTLFLTLCPGSGHVLVQSRARPAPGSRLPAPSPRLPAPGSWLPAPAGDTVTSGSKGLGCCPRVAKMQRFPCARAELPLLGPINPSANGPAGSHTASYKGKEGGVHGCSRPGAVRSRTGPATAWDE